MQTYLSLTGPFPSLAEIDPMAYQRLQTDGNVVSWRYTWFIIRMLYNDEKMCKVVSIGKIEKRSFWLQVVMELFNKSTDWQNSTES